MRLIAITKRALAAALGILAVAVLVGWAWHVDTLKSVVPGLSTMKANTALCFLLTTLSLGTIASSQSASRRFSGGAAMLAGLIGLLTLVEYLGHVRLGIDELLFADPDTTSAPFNGRMSPATAVAFISAGAGLLLIGRGARRSIITAGHALAAVTGLIGLLAVTGYAYDVQGFYRVGPFVAMALHTGVGMIIITLAMLLSRADEGWFAPYVAHPIARSALIRICVLGLLLPFAIGLLVLRGIRAGYYDAQVTPALFAVAAAALLIWLALRSASILARAEEDVGLAEAEAQHRTDALDRTNQRHKALVENLPQLVWTCLPDGRCDYLSPQWVAYTGLGADDQLGLDWLERVIHPEDRARTLEHWMGAVAGHHPYDIEYRIRGADGSYRWFKTRGTPVHDANGATAYWFGTSTDFEDIVGAREVLSRSRTELEQQVEARTAELMAVEAQLRQSQKMEAVGQLTGGVAHDFNNLLTIIRSASDLLRRPSLAEDRRRAYLDAISDTADRAAKLTAQLLAFSRRQALKPELFDANEKVGGILGMLEPILGSQIAVEFIGSSDNCFLEADLSQFETALVNIAVNARDAMDGKGRITVAVRLVEELPPMHGHPIVPGAFVAVSLTDSGIGIPEEQLDRIFEPFFTTKAMGKGTGLGLSQVFGFAKQSGGDVAVVSSPGRGSTFTLYLPQAEETTAQEVGVSEGRAALAPAGHLRVLVVEDNVEVGRFSTQLLEDLGYGTTWAHDAAEALALIDQGNRFDVMFSDVVMPGMNGIDLGHVVRSKFPNMPIILTSGYSDVLADEGRHGFELLKKPYAAEDLSRLLRRTIRG